MSQETKAGGQRHQRILALDPGKRRTGIALSDPTGSLASPLETVTLQPRRLVAHLRSLIELHQVTLVVIGQPHLPSGEKAEIASLAEEIGARLVRDVHVAVEYWDESLTSWQAETILRGTGRPRRGGRSARRKKQYDPGAVDRLAAALILQDYLDARRPPVPPSPKEWGEHD